MIMRNHDFPKILNTRLLQDTKIMNSPLLFQDFNDHEKKSSLFHNYFTLWNYNFSNSSPILEIPQLLRSGFQKFIFKFFFPMTFSRISKLFLDCNHRTILRQTTAKAQPNKTKKWTIKDKRWAFGGFFVFFLSNFCSKKWPVVKLVQTLDFKNQYTNLTTFNRRTATNSAF